VVGAHAQLAGAARRPRFEVGAGGAELVDDPPTMAQQDLPGRSTSRSPTIRSSSASCWLIADCV
jgi:hypothetical protein